MPHISPASLTDTPAERRNLTRGIRGNIPRGSYPRRVPVRVSSSMRPFPASCVSRRCAPSSVCSRLRGRWIALTYLLRAAAGEFAGERWERAGVEGRTGVSCLAWLRRRFPPACAACTHAKRARASCLAARRPRRRRAVPRRPVAPLRLRAAQSGSWQASA